MDAHRDRSDEAQPGISRRQALKRGALIGGAVLWTQPVVQVVGLGRADAQPPSGAGRSAGRERAGDRGRPADPGRP